MSDQTESSLELESEKPDLYETLVRINYIELTWLMNDLLTASQVPTHFLRMTQLNEHLWTQVLKHLNVHIYLLTSVYQVLQST